MSKKTLGVVPDWRAGVRKRISVCWVMGLVDADFWGFGHFGREGCLVVGFGDCSGGVVLLVWDCLLVIDAGGLGRGVFVVRVQGFFLFLFCFLNFGE